MNIVVIPPNLIEVVWPQVEPLMNQVINRAPEDINIEYQKEQLLTGKTWLMAVCEGKNIIAINILKVEEYETGLRVLCNPIVAGTRLNEWMEDAINVAEAIAKDYKCTKFRGFSVRGLENKKDAWLRMLNSGKRKGWKAVHTLIELDIEE